MTATPLGNILTWQPVERVNRIDVAHYQVQRSASPWETLPTNPKDTMYLDATAGSGNLAYRLRAVNIFGVPGAWSQPASQGVPAPGSFTVTALGDTAIQLSWIRPYGRDVAHHEVEYSEDGGNSWSSLAQVTATDQASYTYTDSGLTLNTTRHYRVRGVAMAGGVEFPGAWSPVRSATTIAAVTNVAITSTPTPTPNVDGAGDTYAVGDTEDKEGFDGFIIIDLEVTDVRGGLDQTGVSLQYDPSSRNCQEATSSSTASVAGGSSVLATVGRLVSETGARIRSLFDAVVRLPGSFYRNWETAGAGWNSSPGLAGVWGW